MTDNANDVQEHKRAQGPTIDHNGILRKSTDHPLLQTVLGCACHPCSQKIPSKGSSRRLEASWQINCALKKNSRSWYAKEFMLLTLCRETMEKCTTTMRLMALSMFPIHVLCQLIYWCVGLFWESKISRWNNLVKSQIVSSTAGAILVL